MTQRPPSFVERVRAALPARTDRPARSGDETGPATRPADPGEQFAARLRAAARRA
jgi:hypothetical protein